MTSEWNEQPHPVLPETSSSPPHLAHGENFPQPLNPLPDDAASGMSDSEASDGSDFSGGEEWGWDSPSDGWGGSFAPYEPYSSDGPEYYEFEEWDAANVGGAGGTLEYPPIILPRSVPPLPREDPEPEPVTRRGGGPRGPGGRFRHNPALAEALGELSLPPAGASSRAEAAAAKLRKLRGKSSGGAMRPSDEVRSTQFTPQQRLLLLDTWTRSGLPAGDFAVLVGVGKHTLYAWKKRFDKLGPAGLEDQPRGGPKGSRLPEATKRAILMIKRDYPEYGCERISDLLARDPAFSASAGAVANVLREAGYEAVEKPTHRHPDRVRRFERASPNSLWQTDLFTFVLKRQNRRLHLVIYMDDHSRFIVGWGLFSSPSTELVVETLRSAVNSFQAPVELLTDNGPQYVTWRGKSKFSDACVSLGIKQIVSHPRHPQALGKVERFWRTLWQEMLGTAIFADVADARARIGEFVDHYNFHRPHQGIEGLSPADRYFGKAEEVKETIRRRLAENAARLSEMDAADAAPFTPDGSLAMDPVVDEVPGPGFDALTEGLSAAAAAGGKEADHEDAP